MSVAATPNCSVEEAQALARKYVDLWWDGDDGGCALCGCFDTKEEALPRLARYFRFGVDMMLPTPIIYEDNHRTWGYELAVPMIPEFEHLWRMT